MAVHCWCTVHNFDLPAGAARLVAREHVAGCDLLGGAVGVFGCWWRATGRPVDDLTRARRARVVRLHGGDGPDRRIGLRLEGCARARARFIFAACSSFIFFFFLIVFLWACLLFWGLINNLEIFATPTQKKHARL
jgi:hypothetical protein